VTAQQIRSELDVDQAALRYKAIMFEAQLEALHRSLELESLASLGGLVGAIAHELNTPLGAVHSSASVAMFAAGKLVNGHDPKAARALQENAKVIVDASRRMSELVTRLKVIAGVDQARYSKLDLVQAVHDVMALLRPEYDQRVDINVEHDEIPAVYVHGTDLYQVFLNLLRNSLQAIEGAGTVNIQISAAEDWIRISFADTGRGIPPGQIGQLFTPGFSSNTGRVRASLSLFTCMMIVKKHGGDIRVESEVGRGSTFTVLLPRSIDQIDPRQEMAGSMT
jgi:signal transduction histidine kinase